MDVRLIEHLKSLKEEDLFQPPSGDEIANRKVETEKRKTEEQKAARAKVIELCKIDDIPLNMIKELHEDNLAPNHAVNFTLEQWVEILVGLETENPGSLDRLEDLQQNITGALMSLDNQTSEEMIAQGRRNPKSRWYK